MRSLASSKDCATRTRPERTLQQHQPGHHYFCTPQSPLVAWQASPRQWPRAQKRCTELHQRYRGICLITRSCRTHTAEASWRSGAIRQALCMSTLFSLAEQAHLVDKLGLELLQELQVEQVLRGQRLLAHHRLHGLHVLADGVVGVQLVATPRCGPSASCPSPMADFCMPHPCPHQRCCIVTATAPLASRVQEACKLFKTDHGKARASMLCTSEPPCRAC